MLQFKMVNSFNSHFEIPADYTNQCVKLTGLSEVNDWRSNTRYALISFWCNEKIGHFVNVKDIHTEKMSAWSIGTINKQSVVWISDDKIRAEFILTWC